MADDKKYKSHPSPEKAKEMLKNPPGGKPLTMEQRGFFGLIAGGGTPTKAKK